MKTEKDNISIIGGTHEDSSHPDKEKREREKVMDKFLKPSTMIVDIGCSYGSWANYLHDKGCNVVGVDISSERLKEAMHRGYVPIEASATDLPFDNNEFDGAVMLDVLVHILQQDDRDKAIQEAIRVIKPGGFFILSIANDRGHLTEKPVHYCQFENINRVSRVIEEAGGKVVGVKGIHYTPFMLNLPLPASLARVVFIKVIKK